MRHLLDKDKKKRVLFKKYEYKNLIFKVLLHNIVLPVFIRENIYAILLKSKKISKTMLHNRCVSTYRARFIFTKYKVSRLVFKRLVLRGKIMGVYKKTW